MSRTISTIAKGVLAAATALCLMTGLAQPASAVGDSNSTLLNADSSDAFENTDGIAHAAWLTVSDGNVDAAYTTHKTSSTSSSIINLDNFSNLSVTYSVTNTSDEAKTVNSILALPWYYEVNLSASSPIIKVDAKNASLTNDGLAFDEGTNASAISVGYSGKSGEYTMYSDYAGQYGISDLKALQFKGTMQAGEK